MSFYDDFYEDSDWSGTNSFGERIINPDAYYKAVDENRYGFNSEYSEHQRDNYNERNRDFDYDY